MSAIQRYQKRISGPLVALNAFEAASDIHLEVQRVPYDKLTQMEGGETSASIRTRIEAARERQHERFAPLGKSGLLANGADGRLTRELGRGAGILHAG